MQIRFAAVSAFAALAWGGAAFAQVADGPALTATGQVLSTGNTSLAVETDKGQSMVFLVGTSTELPPGLAAGSRVTVYYREVDERRRMADRVVFGVGSPVSAPARTPPGGGRPGAPDADTAPGSDEGSP